MKYDSRIHHRRSIRLAGYDYSQAGAYFITICCKDKVHRFGTITGDAQDAEMRLSDYGQIAFDEWVKLPVRFSNVELDVFQIMPNHMHGIILVGAGLAPALRNTDNATGDESIVGNIVGAGLAPALRNTDNLTGDKSIAGNIVGAGLAPALRNTDNLTGDKSIASDRAGASPAPTYAIGDIIGAYKSLVANGCLELHKSRSQTIFGKLWQRNYFEHIIRNEQSYHLIADYIINNPLKWADDKFFSRS